MNPTSWISLLRRSGSNAAPSTPLHRSRGRMVAESRTSRVRSSLLVPWVSWGMLESHVRPSIRPFSCIDLSQSDVKRAAGETGKAQADGGIVPPGRGFKVKGHATARPGARRRRGPVLFAIGTLVGKGAMRTKILPGYFISMLHVLSSQTNAIVYYIGAKVKPLRYSTRSALGPRRLAVRFFLFPFSNATALA